MPLFADIEVQLGDVSGLDGGGLEAGPWHTLCTGCTVTPWLYFRVAAAVAAL